MDKIISKLNHIGKGYVNNNLNFYRKSHLLYVITGSNVSLATNHRKNDKFPVKVLRWFDDFWLYIEISFSKIDIELDAWGKDKKDEYLKFIDNEFIKIENNFYSIFFTLSVFQGMVEDDNKTQLFRAEWDNYKDIFSDNHPQPHWHIFPHKYSNKVHADFEDFLGLTKNDEDFNKFKGNTTDLEVVEINRFHFAMNGQWSNNNTDVHKIKTENDLINWFEGVLNHIKKELEYIKVRKTKRQHAVINNCG